MNSLSALHAIKQGILICDRNSNILYFNDAYADYIGVTLEEAKKHKLKEFRENTMVPKVIKTGKPIEGILRQEYGREYFASIYPIIEKEKILGTISIVTSIEQLEKQEEQRNRTLEQRVKEFEKKEIQRLIAVYGTDVECKKKVARELGISLATLYNKLK